MHLIAEDISIRFERPVISGLSVEISVGEFVTVLGPSGSGKSTLLALLSGVLPPDSGEVSVRGEGLRGDEIAELSAWIPQGASALTARSVLANVTLGGFGAGLGIGAAESLAREALKIVGIASSIAQPASILSGGELQRIAVARAMCMQRPFVFADEPTASLDKHNAALVFKTLAAAARQGHAVIVATHDVSNAQLSDSVIQL